MRKNVLIIVEGKSEELIYSSFLNFICKENIRVYSTGGDITSDLRYRVTGSRIIDDLLKNGSRNVNGSRFTDRRFLDHLNQIVIITDTDRCFIPNQNIILSDSKTKYLDDGIHTSNIKEIKFRNKRKRSNINMFLKSHNYNGVKLEVYYNSINLDHVLYNRANMNSHKKRMAAIRFAKSMKTYSDILNFYIPRMTMSYSKSWDYIRYDLNSLKRHSNFGLFMVNNLSLFKEDFISNLLIHLNQLELQKMEIPKPVKSSTSNKCSF